MAMEHEARSGGRHVLTARRILVFVLVQAALWSALVLTVRVAERHEMPRAALAAWSLVPPLTVLTLASALLAFATLVAWVSSKIVRFDDADINKAFRASVLLVGAALTSVVILELVVVSGFVPFVAAAILLDLPDAAATRFAGVALCVMAVSTLLVFCAFTTQQVYETGFLRAAAFVVTMVLLTAGVTCSIYAGIGAAHTARMLCLLSGAPPL